MKEGPRMDARIIENLVVVVVVFRDAFNPASHREGLHCQRHYFGEALAADPLSLAGDILPIALPRQAAPPPPGQPRQGKTSYFWVWLFVMPWGGGRRSLEIKVLQAFLANE